MLVISIEVVEIIDERERCATMCVVMSVVIVKCN